MSSEISSARHSAHAQPATHAGGPPAAAATNLAWAAELWQQGCYHELSARLADELARVEAAGDRDNFAAVANDLACAHRAQGNQETAAYFQLLAATAEHQSGDRAGGWISATSLGNLACDAMLAGRLPIAESLLWKSLLAELAAGNEAGVAADWANLGLLAGLSGELDQAKERLWEALKLHRRQLNPFHTGLDLWHLAQIFEVDNDWQRASKLYEKAGHQFAHAGNVQQSHAAHQRANLNRAREAVLKFDVQVN